MVVRLILALLLTAFALPAQGRAPCHAAPPCAAMAAMQHRTHGLPHSDNHALAGHVCSGCVPLGIPAAAVAAAAPTREDPPQRIVATIFAPASDTPPALPPPRGEA